ncbi:MFS transporter [Bacillus sp. DX4.1]|uniref:staphylopine family metallophore export MFS transporter CntE n=1 Tax=Bacillus sp. DX4.1 TaxID=3055867 RepID=UPI0025A08498|nr:MFS transporter [Bacillus sp. DX4.1]MDM5189443.1 MFS transporter [Bacillus sp. DX4.1]
MNLAPLSRPMLQIYGLSVLFFTSSSMLTVLFPLQAESDAMKVSEIGIVMGIYMLVCMIIRPYAGRIVSKYSSYTVMKYLLLVHDVTLCIYIVFGINGIYVVRVLQGVTTAFFSMAIQQAITKILSNADRGQGMSMYSLSSVVPSLYGPAVALLLWNDAKGYIPFFILVLALIPLLCFVKSPFPKERENLPSFSVRSMFTVAYNMRKEPILYLASFIMLVGALVFSAIATFLPLYAMKEHVGNPSIYLFLQAVVIVGSRFTLRKKIPSDGKWHPRFILLVLLSSVLGTLLLAGETGFYIAAIFNGLASAMLYPTLTTYITFAVKSEQNGMLLGVFLAFYDLGFALGSLATGFIIEYVSYNAMFMVCSVLSILCMVLIIVFKNAKVYF